MAVKLSLVVSLVALLSISGLMAGCGQKGPLYLPEDTEQVKKKP